MGINELGGARKGKNVSVLVIEEHLSGCLLLYLIKSPLEPKPVNLLKS